MNFILKSIGGFFLDIIETVVVALALFMVIYLLLMQPHQVNGESMVPTFENKEYVLTDKVSYRRRLPQKGEIVVFRAPEAANCPQGGCDFIKRIMAVPGDTIEVREGEVVVNGTVLEEPYLPDDYTTQAGSFIRGRRYTLSSNEYFVMGDNRNHSSDSRAWGPIDKSDIVGRVFFRYWPPNKTGVIKTQAFY